MIVRRSAALALPAALLAVMPLAAQTPADTTRLPEIVITATRLWAPRSAVANAVTVLDGAELDRRGVTRVVEALRDVPGLVVVQSGAIGAVTSLFLRGGESDHVRVLVDGIPVNQPGGAVDLAHLATANVERIEVVRGPVSALYGSDAVGGVVAIYSRQAAAPEVTMGLRATESGSILAGSLRQGGPRGGISLAASRIVAPGVHELNHRYRGWSAAASGHVAPAAGTTVQLTARHQDGVYHYPTDFTGAASDSNQYTAGRLTAYSLEAARSLAPALEVRLLLGASEGVDRAVNPPDSAGDFTAYASRTEYGRRSADLRANVRLGQAARVLTVGAALESQRFRAPGDTLITRGNRALYGQLVTPAFGLLTLTAGARAEHNEKFGAYATARAGVALRLGAATVVRVSAGTAFKEPTFYENYDGAFSVGNPDLSPERSRSAELGVEQRLAAGRLVVTATAFTQRFDSLIQYSFVVPAGEPNYRNVAGARARGLELETRAAPWPGGRLTLGWTWLHTAVRDSGVDGTTFAVGRPLLRRPAHSGSLDLVQRVGAADVGATLRYVGEREDVAFVGFTASRVVLPAHARLDVQARRQLAGPLALTVDVDNALGKRYQEAFGFPARGRTVWVGAALGRH